jgi:hypothetical protein
LRWGTLYKTGVGKIRSAEGTEYGQELNPSEPYVYRTSNRGRGAEQRGTGREVVFSYSLKKLYFEK